MDLVSYCKSVWSSASSDTEKFAALLVFTKAGKPSDLPKAQLHEIFECIGVSFLSRLLRTKEIPKDCAPTVYKRVAVSILSCMCTDPLIAGSNEMCSLIPEYKNMLDADWCKNEESLVMDTLYCIYSMSYCENGRNHILEYDVVSSLVNLYTSDSFGKRTSLEILKNMASHCKSEMWIHNPVLFNDLFSKICKEFSEDCSNAKLCESIFILLLYHPLLKIEGGEEYAQEIQVALTNILRSKVTKMVRDVAIKLASLMVEKCGTSWFENHTENSTLFYLVLIQVVSVEVCVILEDRSLETIVEDDTLLTGCFCILEKVVSTMVNENLWRSFSAYTKELITSVRTAYKAVLEFLHTVSTQWDSLGGGIEFNLKQLTWAAIKSLCAWLTEETGVFQNEVCKVLPFILRVCSENPVGVRFEDLKYASADENEYDVMQFFIYPLGHLTADDTSRAVLLENKLLKVLFHYIYYKWSHFQQHQCSESEVIVSCGCEAILNVIVMEPKVVPESGEFYDFLRFLFEAVLQLPSDIENSKTLVLKANFSAMGLLIVKQLHRRISACEISFYKFLSFSIKFLWDAHHVENGAFSLVREYYCVWPDVMELWFLGMQALSALLPVMQWIANFLIESGWPQHIIISLSRVEENVIEKSVKYAYQAFLCSLVRVSSHAKRTLNDCDATVICEKHEFSELKMLLDQ